MRLVKSKYISDTGVIYYSFDLKFTIGKEKCICRDITRNPQEAKLLCFCIKTLNIAPEDIKAFTSDYIELILQYANK